jgi:hypothetical protein
MSRRGGRRAAQGDLVESDGGRVAESQRSVRRVATGAWRRATARARPLPTFLIIGAQKGGTSSLYEYLQGSPAVRSARRKEIHFFESDGNWRKGTTWYRMHFPFIRGSEVTGEATPSLVLDPRAPERCHQTVPDCRLIVLLREPVARAESHYWHNVRRGREALGFAEAIDREEERLAAAPLMRSDHKSYSYLERGHYADQLTRWLAWYPRSSLLVLESEELFRDPADIVRRVADWLGSEAPARGDMQPMNAGTYEPMAPALRERLEAHFRAPNAALVDLLGADAPTWATSAPVP